MNATFPSPRFDGRWLLVAITSSIGDSLLNIPCPSLWHNQDTINKLGTYGALGEDTARWVSTSVLASAAMGDVVIVTTLASVLPLDLHPGGGTRRRQCMLFWLRLCELHPRGSLRSRSRRDIQGRDTRRRFTFSRSPGKRTRDTGWCDEQHRNRKVAGFIRRARLMKAALHLLPVH